MCDICNKGGELVLCYTCSRCNHWECDKNMPMHVHNLNTMYRCPTCVTENGNTTDKLTKKTEEKHKWYTTTTNMNIIDSAKHMNTTATDYLHFLRKFHPWGTKNHKKELKHTTDILTKNAEIPYRYATNHRIKNDTGTTSMRVRDTTTHIKQFLEKT